MNKKLSAILILFAIGVSVSAQDKPAYSVFTGTGKKSDYSDIIKEAGKTDVVFFGELHDNPVARSA